MVSGINKSYLKTNKNLYSNLRGREGQDCNLQPELYPTSPIKLYTFKTFPKLITDVIFFFFWGGGQIPEEIEHFTVKYFINMENCLVLIASIPCWFSSLGPP